jgi:hypothetical protein
MCDVRDWALCCWLLAVGSWSCGYEERKNSIAEVLSYLQAPFTKNLTVNADA